MKKIPGVELGYFSKNIAYSTEYCIQGTQFLWEGSVNQLRVDKWIIDSVHTEENWVCYHIDSFFNDY